MCACSAGGKAICSGVNPNERLVLAVVAMVLDVADPGIFLGDPGCKYENSEAIVRVRGDAVIEGFTIAGAAQIGYFGIVFPGEPVGGGLCVDKGRPTVQLCTFRGNLNRYDGAAICGKSLAIRGCTFERNCASRFGGAVCIAGSINDCVFNGNKAVHGGAAGALAPGVNAANCLFVGNRALARGWEEASGGAIRCANERRHRWLRSGTVRLTDCTFHDNRAEYGAALYNERADVSVVNCIFRDGPLAIWDTEGTDTAVRYSSIEGGRPGTGNIDAEPCFAAPGHWDPNGTPDDPNDDVWVDGDYHLKSQAGRWDPNTQDWVIDDVTSPCIDAGLPNSPVAFEPFPNGGIINMGAYGGTAEASKSPSGLHAQYGGGTGEPNDPYLIYTAEHLDAIGTEPNDWDKHFRLMADLDLSPYEGTEFNIIDTGTQPFGGTFDGNGHKILHFTYRSSGKDDVGLFGCVYQRHPFDTRGLPVIKDLGLIDPNVEAGDGSFVGALIGCYGDGVITGCFVQSGSVSGRDVVGGLIGGFARFVEGLAPPISRTTSGQITDCYSRARVSGTRWVGGLAGTHDHWISRCYSTGVVSGSEWVGGLTGCGHAEDSFWDVEASGQTASSGGEGRTTAEMQMAGTFLTAGWDFVDETANGTEDIWWIDEGRDYPRLCWEPSKEATP
ncbi:MAG: right-handed parallel beta-helix repeat-containing protein [Sedimentisphaerales bacterium]|nr:right-handed parallel beta-helix repeat-containing protein [Sedimentisphaerales bacterium]